MATAGRGAGGVAKRTRAAWQVRLAATALVEGEAAAGLGRAHLGEGLGVLDQGHVRRPRQAGARAVVVGRTETTRHDDEVGVGHGGADPAGHRRGGVPDEADSDHPHPEPIEPSGEPGSVSVPRATDEQLVPHDEDHGAGFTAGFVNHPG